MSGPKDYVDRTSHRDALSKRRDNYESYDGVMDKYAYKYFGDMFDDRPQMLEDMQDNLKAAQIPVGSDLYMGRLVLYTIGIGGFMFLMNMLISILLLLTGLTSGIFSSKIVEALFLIMYPVLIGLFSAGGFAVFYYFRPRFVASQRASAIDATLPSAVTFVYALNRGGMTLVEALRKLAENEEVYGEVSREVATIIQDMEYFSRDLMEAARRAGERSPSQKFTDLMDDMVSTMDSGAETDEFLKDKSEDLIDEAERDQEKFIETLGLLGEVYVTAFVAGPLFMIIITVIMSMLGGTSPTQLDGIVYGLLPFMNVGYYFLIDTLSGVDDQSSRTISKDDYVTRKSNVDVDEFVEQASDDRVERVYEAKKKRERTALIREPVAELLRRPNQTMYFTVPLALIYLLFAVVSGIAQPSYGAFIDAPVPQTVAWLLLPTFIVAVPLAIFYEISSRREKKIMNRLPEALKQLASANSVGMTLTEAMNHTAENTTGRLGQEMNRVRNDIKWNHNVNSALISLANRVQIPILTRTSKLITEANSSTGNIEDVLSVAAKNVQTQVRLEKERRASMLMYTAVILISFCVYMFVIALIDVMFLSTIAEISQESSGSLGGGSSGGGGSGSFELSELPVERFRLVFYHSTIIQSFGSGMIAGYLSANDIRSGLKFAIILSVISSALFFFL